MVCVNLSFRGKAVMSNFNGTFLTVSQHIMECIKEELAQLERLDLYSARGEFLECIERAIIHEALRRSNGRKGEAAKLLGIDVKTLYNKLNDKNKVAQIIDDNRQEDSDPKERFSAIK